MPKNKLNLSAVNFKQGFPKDNAYYLPYSIGLLWAYASTLPSITDNWAVGHVGFKRDDIDEIYKEVADADVLGLSCYIWNKNYNYALGKKVKEYNPKIKIVLGGPEPAISNKNLFQELPWADIIVKKEGEVIFTDLLANINSFDTVKGLCINDNGHFIDTGEASRIKDINIVPSPYLSGIFDDIIKQHPNFKWNTILETNRGCPYQCTFCDWGSLTYSKITKFNLDRVFSELEWMAENKIDHVVIADANFGMFVERDNAIIDKIIDIQKQTGFPKKFNLTWAKNQKVEIIKLVKKLYLGGINSGLMVSLQSTTDEVLENIKRKNLETNRISETVELCTKEGIPLSTELILGLPGETLLTWKKNITNILDIGLHSGINIYLAQLIENTELNLVQKKQFDIKTKLISDFYSGSKQDKKILENINIITSTKDMSFDDIVSAFIYNWFITTFHMFGLSQFYVRYLNKKHKISYYDFYENLFDYIKQDTWFKTELVYTKKIITDYLSEGKQIEENIHGIDIDGVLLLYLGAMRMNAYDFHKNYFDLIDAFINATYKDLIEKDVLEDIKSITVTSTVSYSNMSKYPKQISCKTNAYEYIILDADDINKQETKLNFEFLEYENDMDLEKFLHSIYLRRKRHFTRTRITKI